MRHSLRSTLSGSVALPVLVAMLAPAGAQGVTELSPIVVETQGAGAGSQTGLVAGRSNAGSKTDTPLIETPQAVNVVTREQMDAQAVKTVPEALRYTPGVNYDPNGYDIRYDWLNIRGFNAFGYMWLDGLMLPGDPNGYATPSINPYALERVEVIKGPASVLYGRSIPGGLVNLVGKRPQAETHREASVSTNGFGGIEGSVDMTGKLTEDGQFLYRFVGSAKNLNTQILHEQDRQVMFAPSISWVPTDDTTLTLYGYYQRDTPIFSPRFYPATGTLLPSDFGQIPSNVFLGDPTWGSFERDFYAAGYEFEHRFNETFTVRQNLRYAYADQHMDLVLVNPAFAYSAEGSVLDRVTAVSDDQLSSIAVDTQLEARFGTGALDHTMLFGFDYVRTRSDTSFGNSDRSVVVPQIDYLAPVYGLDFPVAAVTRAGSQTQNQAGFYAQDQIKYDNWIGTFGLRYDLSEIKSTDLLTATATNTLDKELTGRAGLTYVFDNGIAPYVSYSTSFLPLLGRDRLGNPFEALSAEQVEVGVKYEPTGGRGMITLSVFDMRIDGALTPDPADTLFSVQTGKQHVQGFEVEGKYELTPDIDVLASYAFSYSRITESNNVAEFDKPILRLPEHQGALWVSYKPPVLPGLSLSAGVRAQSSYHTSSTYSPDLLIPARALVDIGAEYDFGAFDKDFDGTKLQVSVTNLFNEEYVSHCLNTTGGSCNYGAGRAVNASLKYTW